MCVDVCVCGTMKMMHNISGLVHPHGATCHTTERKMFGGFLLSVRMAKRVLGNGHICAGGHALNLLSLIMFFWSIFYAACFTRAGPCSVICHTTSNNRPTHAPSFFLSLSLLGIYVRVG